MDIDGIISKMTLTEKAIFLSGKNAWETQEFPQYGIPSVWLADGPHGIRRQSGPADHLGMNESNKATCFPTSSLIANSWDILLSEKIGEALGREARFHGVQVLLGPGVNIKRNPLCGRNFEYFSEDPYLSGKMAAGYINGVQKTGTAACIKHFAANSQEICRMTSDSTVDERTLREIYLTAFEIAIKESSPKSLMTSYNKVNGVYANEHHHLLIDILRKEWGFHGCVISDWGASDSHTEGVRNGSSLEMPAPGYYSSSEITEAVSNGCLKMDSVNERVHELLDLIDWTKITATAMPKTVNHDEHHSIAQSAAENSIVLLKNEENILPLKAGIKVAVLGDYAIHPRFQGSGSSMVNPAQVDIPLTVLKTTGLQIIGFSKGYEGRKMPSRRELQQTLTLAGQADCVLLYLGLEEAAESEAVDRKDMRLNANQIFLLEKVSAVNPNVIVLLSGGSAIEMPWRNCCKAILYIGLSGQAGASAACNILMGKVNPSGKLTESFPEKYEDTPAFHYYMPECRKAEYREGIYVGYRYYKTNGIRVAYPFGYGLSYTEFEYMDLTADESKVTFSLRNSGDMDGAEVVQLYISKYDSVIFRPEIELKGFKKIFLKSGETQYIEINFDDMAFRFYNTKTGRWETESGQYRISIGASSEDIRLYSDISIQGTEFLPTYNRLELPDYFSGQIQTVGQDEFNMLCYGKHVPKTDSNAETNILSRNDAVYQMKNANNLGSRIVFRILDWMKHSNDKKGKLNLNIYFVYYLPFRGIAKLTNGNVNMEMVDDILQIINGKPWSGIKQLIQSFRKAKQEKKIRDSHLRTEKK